MEEIVQISAVDISLGKLVQSGGWSDMGSSSVHGRYPCVCVAGLAKSIGYPTEDKEAASFQGVGACSIFIVFPY